MRYEPSGINFHLGETPPREPQGGREQTESTAATSLEPDEMRARSRSPASRDERSRRRRRGASPHTGTTGAAPLRSALITLWSSLSVPCTSSGGVSAIQRLSETSA